MPKFKKELFDYTAYFICFLFALVGSIVSLHRYWQYEVTHIDFGQYDRAIWLVSRFQEPIVHHFVHGTINVLGDHVTPSIFLISPVYWVTNRSEAILLIQALAVGLSGFFLYGLAKHVLKYRPLALSILIIYFLFVGLQYAVITEFHELTVMTLPLMISFWAIVKDKKKLYFAALLITLGFKESTFLLGIGIGIALFFLKKEWRRVGVLTIIISLVWAFVAFLIFIPHFGNGIYQYASSFPESPTDKLLALGDHPLKRRTLMYSFLSFSFLPIFSPQFWPVILQDYAARFLPLNFMTRWDLTMHYNAQSAVLLAVSSVFGLNFLLRFSLIKKHITILSIILILNSFFLFRFILHGPFLLAINPTFYAQTQGFKFLDDMVARIPKDATVMAQNNIAAHLTRQDTRLLSPNYNLMLPDYILMDLRDGQSPNNFCCPGNLESAKEIYTKLSKDKGYKLIYKTQDQFIFQKID